MKKKKKEAKEEAKEIKAKEEKRGRVKVGEGEDKTEDNQSAKENKKIRRGKIRSGTSVVLISSILFI